MDLHTIVKKSQNGDTGAFGELYDLFADKLFRFILLKVKDKQHAEDILQDTFVKAWHGLPTLDAEHLNFNAWVYKVASNTVNDYFRKRYRTPETVELDDGLTLTSSDSPEQEMQLSYESAEIHHVLKLLPRHYQQVLELRFIQDFTVQETAEILGRNSLSVRVLQHRALARLKNELSNIHANQTQKI
ncbi:MAG TPA: sigma-70 family RNA polymerase sigma factor [Patescibacteria group bacterium]|nr:sigma-70 family RNA polymerase sigma factor [Patescibacteria group bacterium]